MAEDTGHHAEDMVENGDGDAPDVAMAAENGGGHAADVAVAGANRAAENGGGHAPAVDADSGGVQAPDIAVAAAKRGDHAHDVAVDAAKGDEENGGGHAPDVAVDATSGDKENGEVLDPAHAAATANGGNVALVHAAVAVNRNTGNAGTVIMDLALDSFHEIFIRLPAAMIRRCRDVCRIWRDTTRSEDFQWDLHHIHRSLNPMPLFLYQPESYYENSVIVHLHAADIRRRESFPVFHFGFHPAPYPDMFRIHGSCDGILLLSFGASLYACNPCTGCWRRLRSLHLNGPIVGFYAFDRRRRREYRVLWQDNVNHDVEGLVYRILSLHHHSPRYIGRPTTLQAIGLRHVLAGGISFVYVMPPIMLRRSLHWVAQPYHHDRHLLVFNTVAERFHRMRPPPVLQRYNRRMQDGALQQQLLEIDGRLAMMFYVTQTTTLHVWVLRDYIRQVWDFEYRIQLPAAEIQRYHDYGYAPPIVFAVSVDRNVLVQCTNALLQYDANGTLLHSYELPYNYPILSGYVLQESLLQHDFLPLGPNDALNCGLPFFQARGVP